MKSKIFLILAILAISSHTLGAQALFSSMSFDEITKQAKTEKKPFFVDLTASWCLPCRLMDETVFQDQLVQEYVDKHYLAIQLDVEDFDAMILKEKYHVISLPTVLFFNAKGMMIAKEEGLQTGTNFLKILEKNQSKKL